MMPVSIITIGAPLHIPKELICPILQDEMQAPYSLDCAHVFELNNIKTWIAKQREDSKQRAEDMRGAIAMLHAETSRIEYEIVRHSPYDTQFVMIGGNIVVMQTIVVLQHTLAAIKQRVAAMQRTYAEMSKTQDVATCPLCRQEIVSLVPAQEIKNKIETLKSLLTEFFEPNGFESPGKIEYYSPLTFAIKLQRLDVCKKLLYVGYSIDEANALGNTPAHIAFDTANAELILWVLAQHPKLDVRNLNGETPLDIARRHNLLHLVQEALDKELDSARKAPGVTFRI